MAEKELSDLFVDTLKDIYYAEKQIYKSLPKMAKAAHPISCVPPSKSTMTRRKGTSSGWKRFSKRFGKPARGKKCDAIEGILDEGKEIMEEYGDYAGARCRFARRRAGGRTLRNLALWHAEDLGEQARPGRGQAALRDTGEEKKTDDALTKLAVSAINAEAA